MKTGDWLKNRNKGWVLILNIKNGRITVFDGRMNTIIKVEDVEKIFIETYQPLYPEKVSKLLNLFKIKG